MTAPQRILVMVAVLGGLALLAWWLLASGPERDGELSAPLTIGGEEISAPAPPRAEVAAAAGESAIETAPFDSAAAAATDEEASSDSFGSLRITVIYAEDESVAAGVGVRLIPWGGADPFLHERYGITDEAGLLLEERVRPGSVGVYGHLGGSTRCEVEAGKQGEATVRMPKGCTVQGVVVDEGDQPVPGAGIWLSRDGNFVEGWQVATADREGRFRLRSVQGDTWRTVGARAPRRGPSPLHIVLASPGDVVELRLVLSGPGGDVEGRVYDSAKAPVAGARIEIGPREHRQLTLPDGGRAAQPGQVVARSDAQGRFQVFGLAPGEVPVLARAPGHAPWRGTVKVEARTRRKIEIELGGGILIEGLIRDAAGEPAEKVSVCVGRYGDFMSSWTRTDAEGRFRLEGVVPGEIVVEADGEERGKAKTSIHAAAGEKRWWETRLIGGLTIRGRLLDTEGKALAGWSVGLMGHGSGEWDHQRAVAGDDGRFVASGCIDAPYRLEVFAKGGGVFPLKVLTGVRPDAEELELRVEGAHDEPGAVVGCVLGPDGSPVAGVRVSLGRPDGGGSPIETTEHETGRFRFAPTPAGTYLIQVNAPGFPPWKSDLYELTPGATLDLGAVRLEIPGWVVISVRRPAAASGIEVTARFRPAGGGRARKVTIPGEIGRSPPLAAGSYTLEVSATGLVTERREIRADPGEETRVEVTLRLADR